MKNRLTLLALAMLCYGHMQAAATGEKGWFANQWDRMKSYIPSYLREYTPYQQGSFKVYPPENVTSRLASMRHLHGDNVAQDQEQLIADYKEYLENKLLRQNTRNINYDDAELALQYLAANRPNNRYFRKILHHTNKQWNRGQRKWSTINNAQRNLVPSIKRQEAEMLRPRTFYEYQHPDQYILNN